jgi:hypothetical protein
MSPKAWEGMVMMSSHNVTTAEYGEYVRGIDFGSFIEPEANIGSMNTAHR